MADEFATTLHLSVALLSIAGLFALAFATERHGEHLLGRLPAPRWSRFARVAGWLLLVVALTLGIRGLGAGVGITLWLGWLTPMALSLVFLFPKWTWRPPARDKPVRQVLCFPDAMGSMRVSRRAGQLLLGLTIAGFVVALWRAEPQPLGRADALHSQVGPWTFTLVEANRSVPERKDMDVAVKTFQVRFCDACQQHIRRAWLKVGKPYLPREPGMAFETRFGVQQVEIPLPSTLDAQSTIWLTVMGKDGTTHQMSWHLHEAAPATAAWIARRTDAHH